MDRSQWRRWAEIVAYFDLIYSSIVAILDGLFFVGLLVLTLTGHLSRAIEEISKTYKESVPFLAWGVGILWAVVVIFSIVSIVQLWAATKLMKGTEMGREASEALRLCTIWRNVSIFFFICYGLFYPMGGITVVIGLLLRGTRLFIVCKFMMEHGSSQNAMPRPGGFAV